MIGLDMTELSEIDLSNCDYLRMAENSVMDISGEVLIGDSDRNAKLNCQNFDSHPMMLSDEHVVHDFDALDIDSSGDSGLGDPNTSVPLLSGNVASLGNGSDRGMTRLSSDNDQVFEGENVRKGFVSGHGIAADKIPNVSETHDFPNLLPLTILEGNYIEDSPNMDVCAEICNNELLANRNDCKEYEDTTYEKFGSVAHHPSESDGIIGQDGWVSSSVSETNWINEICKDMLLTGSTNLPFTDDLSRMQEHTLMINDNNIEKKSCCVGNSETISSHGHGTRGEQDVAFACNFEGETYVTIQELHHKDSHCPNESCSLSHRGSEVAISSTLEDEYAFHHCISNGVNCSSSKQVSIPDACKHDGDDVCCSQLINGSISVSYGKSSSNGKDNVKSDSIQTHRRTNPKRAASSKNSSDSLISSKQSKVATLKKTRKSKKSVVCSTAVSSSGLSIFLGTVARKKRSPRIRDVSGWGKIQNLHALFLCNCGDSNLNNDLNFPKRVPRKTRCNLRSQFKAQKSTSVNGANCDAFTSSVDLSKKSTSQSILPALDKSKVLLYTGSNACLHNNNQISTVFSVEQGYSANLSIPTQHPHTYAQKNLFENNTSGSQGILPETGSKSLVGLVDEKLVNYLDTSPESDIIHPTADIGILVSDSITSSSQEPSVNTGSGSNSQNGCPLDNAVQDNLHPDISNVLDIAMQVNSTHLMQHVIQKKEKSNKDQGSLYQASSVVYREQTTDDLISLNKESDSGRCNEFANNIHVDFDSQDSNLKSKRRLPKKTANRMLVLADLPLSRTSDLESDGKNCTSFEKSAKKIDVPHSTNKGEIKTEQAFPLTTKTKSQIKNKTRTNTIGKKKSPKEVLCHSASEQKSQVLDAFREGNLPSITNESFDNTFGLEKDHIQVIQPLNAWVCCDDCNKWRCIPAELADVINETGCKWICKDNNDKAFSDCLTPQEKTNAEINAELQISDVSCEEGSQSAQPNSKKPDQTIFTALQQSSWKRIKTNMFLHRNRKTQNIDEIMVCHCKPPLDGSPGCGDECLNRMLNIECVRGRCPCGELCSNQKFQKRKYAKLKQFPCGKKGSGLQLLENVSEGTFLIEYVGEVLDMASYEARQKYYASRGQRHFYFMTLNGSEVIDACSKGNMGRFINHSCEPNCCTEKWMVNGEICIGLFALRNLKEGEEVTFNYNYVRIFGAAAKKCVCGSADCLGYIGGDLSKGENIVAYESDEEYSEPIIVHEEGKKKKHLDKVIINTTDVTAIKHKNNERMLDIVESSHNMVEIASVRNEVLSPQHTDTLNTSSAKELVSLETMGLHEALPDVTDLDPSENLLSLGKKLKHINKEDKTHVSKSKCYKKPTRHNKSTKKTQVGISKRLNERAIKNGGLGSRKNYFDEVAEKLKQLIGPEGGIIRRKDAAKGYLRLLVVTAADNLGTEAIQCQSTRDLSLILDALLKTKSRTVLSDVINKNGLQMLHNIMKQNRKNSNKIPILRKILKVLKYLVENKVLLDKEINKNSSCPGVESLRDSIVSLIHHNDKEVSHAAREFRNKWIHRITEKSKLQEQESGYRLYNSHKMKSSWSLQSLNHSREYIVRDADGSETPCPSTSSAYGVTSKSSGPCNESSKFTVLAPSSNFDMTIGTNTRKRKSRWDQDKPLEKNYEWQIKDCTGNRATEASLELTAPESNLRQEKYMIESGSVHYFTHGVCKSYDSRQQDDDDVPPGFDSNIVQHEHSDCDISVVDNEMVVGKHQETYISRLPISRGIPLVPMQKSGTPINKDEEGHFFKSWAIAPGISFHPFPPLPLYPRGN